MPYGGQSSGVTVGVSAGGAPQNGNLEPDAPDDVVPAGGSTVNTITFEGPTGFTYFRATLTCNLAATATSGCVYAAVVINGQPVFGTAIDYRQFAPLTAVAGKVIGWWGDLTAGDEVVVTVWNDTNLAMQWGSSPYMFLAFGPHP